MVISSIHSFNGAPPCFKGEDDAVDEPHHLKSNRDEPFAQGRHGTGNGNEIIRR
jgi:hypothetical protein